MRGHRGTPGAAGTLGGPTPRVLRRAGVTQPPQEETAPHEASQWEELTREPAGGTRVHRPRRDTWAEPNAVQSVTLCPRPFLRHECESATKPDTQGPRTACLLSVTRTRDGTVTNGTFPAL